MDTELLDRLVGAEGRALLADVGSQYDGHNALAVSDRLRRRHDPDLVAAALTQVDLRTRAAAKFGPDAARMFFTPAGLEQATHGVVAVRRARRIAASGVRRLLELGCGIGSDLVAIARAGVRVTAVERDVLTAAVARANLAALGLPGVVEVGDATERDRAAVDGVFTDPARRSGTGRLFDPDAFSPPWSFVEQLLTGAAVVKAAPGLPHDRVPAGVEAEWVSLDGDLREATLWSGRLSRVGRRASVLTSRGIGHELTDADDVGVAAVATVGQYVYEPDDAVIRAHLVTAVAATVDGWLLDPHLAYVSSDREVRTPFARGYRVVEVLPYREKQLRAALRARGIGTLTIKKRGVDVTPETLRQRLALRGSEPATVILSRTPASAVALLVEPLPTVEYGHGLQRPSADT